MGTPLIDIPIDWDPQAKQQQRVALADFSAAPWQGFEKSERGPNNSSLFQPQAAVVVVAVRILPIAQKESPAHESVSGILGAPNNENPNLFSIGEGFGFFVFFGKQNEGSIQLSYDRTY